MKTLYYLSHILSAPFYVISWIAYCFAYVFCLIGDYIYDWTTYRAWLILHQRKVKEIQDK